MTLWRGRIGAALLVPLLGALAATAGCGPKIKAVDKDPAGEVEMRTFISLYSAASGGLGKAPTNAEQVKAWAKKQPATKLKELGIEDVDKALVSPRDNQPYVVRPNTSNDAMAIVAHEKTGAGGKRYAAMAQGAVMELDEAEFKSRLSGGP